MFVSRAELTERLSREQNWEHPLSRSLVWNCGLAVSFAETWLPLPGLLLMPDAGTFGRGGGMRGADMASPER